MDDKNKYLYDATAHITETLIDNIIGGTQKDPAVSERRRKDAFINRRSLIAAVLALTLVVTALAVTFSIKKAAVTDPHTTSSDPHTTRPNVEPFKGTAGDYSGALYMCLADVSFTASNVYGREYRKVQKTYRQNAAELGAFFDKLTQKLLEGRESAVVSPVNIYMALSMLAECTSGTSRKQILDIIGVSSIEELREQSKIIWLYNSRDDEFGKSLLGNSVWLSSDMPVKENCVEILKNDHYASTFTGNFASDEYKKALKQWLSDQTCGLLDGFINALDISDDTRAVLASTLYYKVKWAIQYRETEEGVFKGTDGRTDCVFNKKSFTSVIYYGDGFTAFHDTLSDGNSMWFFLPDYGKSTEDVIKSDLISFIGSEKTGKTYDVTVRMPDFDVDFNESIIDILYALGVTDCTISSKADFSELTDDDIFVNQIIHAARFKADKEGVEGAAFTGIRIANGYAVDHKDYDFTLDKPFVFMVVNNGVPLFTGTVSNIQ